MVKAAAVLCPCTESLPLRVSLKKREAASQYERLRLSFRLNPVSILLELTYRAPNQGSLEIHCSFPSDYSVLPILNCLVYV